MAAESRRPVMSELSDVASGRAGELGLLRIVPVSVACWPPRAPLGETVAPSGHWTTASIDAPGLCGAVPDPGARFDGHPEGSHRSVAMP